jgi:hypothetical protein
LAATPRRAAGRITGGFQIVFGRIGRTCSKATASPPPPRRAVRSWPAPYARTARSRRQPRSGAPRRARLFLLPSVPAGCARPAAAGACVGCRLGCVGCRLGCVAAKVRASLPGVACRRRAVPRTFRAILIGLMTSIRLTSQYSSLLYSLIMGFRS